MIKLWQDPLKRKASIAGVVWVMALGGVWLIPGMFKQTIPWWGKALLILLLGVAFLLFYMQELAKLRHAQRFAEYVARYHLTPVTLAAITGFYQYDFPQDNQGRLRFIYLENKAKRTILFEKLASYDEKQKSLR